MEDYEYDEWDVEDFKPEEEDELLFIAGICVIIFCAIVVFW